MEFRQSQVDGDILSMPHQARYQEAPVLPRISVAPARAMYVGPGLRLAPHLNAAATIAVALDAPFELRTHTRARAWSGWRSTPSCLIAAETLHHLKSNGPMVFLYLDPLADRHRLLRQAQLDGGRERMHEAAALACLSPSRFRARFRAEVGLPFRRYRMWRRMALVMRTIAQGGSLTHAALAAGFSGSAHLSSSFKRMFGLPASDIIALGVAIDVSEDCVVPTSR
jgi:AraC-like DNA-binding protein